MNNDPITNEQIDALLDQYRPDRYERHDASWRSPVVQAVALRIPVTRAQQVAAEKIVGDREGQATKSVNRLLRRINEERQWPLPEFALDIMARPLSINDERVRLGAAASEDFVAWAIAERRAASQEATARFSACDGAEWIAEQMNAESIALFGDRYATKRAAA